MASHQGSIFRCGQLIILLKMRAIGRCGLERLRRARIHLRKTKSEIIRSHAFWIVTPSLRRNSLVVSTVSARMTAILASSANTSESLVKLFVVDDLHPEQPQMSMKRVVMRISPRTRVITRRGKRILESSRTVSENVSQL